MTRAAMTGAAESDASVVVVTYNEIGRAHV